MVIFWIVIAVMILAALAFIVWPLLWGRPSTAPDSTTLSVALFKDRLQSLEQQQQAGEITAAEYERMHLELQHSALNEIPAAPANLVKPQPSGRWLAIVLLIALPVSAIVFYLASGTYQQMASFVASKEKAAAINAEIASLGSLSNIITKLKQRVQENPDGHGWFLLGRLYMKEQHFPEAVAAFAQAQQLTPDQPDIMVAYAEALYFAKGQVLNPQAIALLTRALKREPHQAAAINLLAINAYQRGNYQQAADFWQELLPQYPVDSDESRLLLRTIAAAQQQVNRLASATVPNIKLPVFVRLAPALKNKIRGGETLFIYAQAVGGPAMPLAVVRRQAQDLPLEITLTEHMGMMPGVSLADFPKVKIIARISKSGQPLPASGDLEGSSEVIEVKHPPEQIDVVIDGVTP